MRVDPRSERGTTLIEVLMAGTMMIVVLSATLMLFEAAADNHLRVERHNEAQDTARRETDRLARQLRNLASPKQLSCPIGPGPTPASCLAQPLAVDRADAFDFVFRVVDVVRPAGSANVANVKRLRYCLNTSDPSDGRLYTQKQMWTTVDPPPVPTAASCPGAGWDAGGDALVTASVVNHRAATPRPMFVFDSPDAGRIAHVRTDLFVDPDPTRNPPETRLTSGVYLRNQNRVPTADFTVTANAATNLVILNGSLSDDPESLPLEYWWYVDGGATPIGQGVVLNHTPADGTHVYRLIVKDTAGLQAELTRTVTV